MSWWGKLVGGAFGFMLGGPLGAVFGAAVGHGFDRGLAQDGAPQATRSAEQERIQAAFFTATFSVMGHVAKVDGRVTEDEIAVARAIMQQMALNEAQQRVARELFGRGKQADFDFVGVLEQFRRECRRRHNLLQMFLEIQLHAAYADGELHVRERALIEQMALRLGFAPAELARLESMVRAQHGANKGESAGRGQGRQRTAPRGPDLAACYAMLGVPATASDDEVKRAYRRLMNQHHPDKLVARGLPEEMVKIANARTQEIREAWEQIKAARARG